MSGARQLWEPVLRRLRLTPRGLRDGAIRYGSARVTVDWSAWTEPVRIRVKVRPREAGSGRLLVVPLERSPTLPRFPTGDVDFDRRVAVLAGGRAALCRLGPQLRHTLAELVDDGAAVTESGVVFEPEVVATWSDPDVVLDRIWRCHDVVDDLCGPLEPTELLRRWRVPDAPQVASSVEWRVSSLLPRLDGRAAELACRVIEERGESSRAALLARMAPSPTVLTTWLRLCDPLDPRLVDAVRLAYEDGDADLLARYLAWLLGQDSAAGHQTVLRLWAELGASADPKVVQALVARLDDVNDTTLSLLLQVEPPTAQAAGAVAALLAPLRDPRVDPYLARWLTDDRARAATDALVQRVEVALAAGDHAAAERVRPAAERTSELALALIRQLGPFADPWLATLEPRSEEPVLALIERLRRCGRRADSPLLFWLEHGPSRVQLRAAAVLGEVGSARALGPLDERATQWLTDSALKTACRKASARIRERGGVGGLSIAQGPGGELSSPPPAGALSEG